MKNRRHVYIASACITIAIFFYVPTSGQTVDSVTVAPTTIVPHMRFLVPTPPPEALQAAIKGKITMELLVGNNDKHAGELGFESAADAADSNDQLGVPFPIIRINFDMLRSYKPTTSPTTLLIPTTEFIYPVTVNGEVRSSLTVTGIRADSPATIVWRTTEWGAKGLIRALDTARKTAHASNLSFDLEIRELGRHFLGDITGGQFSIIPLYDEPTLGFKKGVPLPTDVTFQKLVPEANLIPSPPDRRSGKLP